MRFTHPLQYYMHNIGKMTILFRACCNAEPMQLSSLLLFELLVNMNTLMKPTLKQA